jgi:hypothetical protein
MIAKSNTASFDHFSAANNETYRKEFSESKATTPWTFTYHPSKTLWPPFAILSSTSAPSPFDDIRAGEIL